MHDGVLYVTTAWSKVMAYDAKTGALKWTYDPEVPRETLVRWPAATRSIAASRSMATRSTSRRSTDDLVALNQADGTVAWRKQVVPDKENYTITGAPRVANGKVLIGIGRRGIPGARLHRRLRLADRQGGLALPHRARQPGRTASRTTR